jgi:ABC-type antimicrobial peptide transport system permease subunit
MSRFLSARLRKSLSDLTRRKARTLLMVLGIFIAVFGLTAINVTENTLVSAFAFTRGYQASQPDYQLTVDTFDPALLPTLQAVPNVGVVQYISSFTACWQLSNGRCAVGLDLFSAPDLQHLPITQFQLSAGRYPGAGEVLMEQSDQSLHPVAIGDTISVYGGDQTAQLRVVGLTRTPGSTITASGDALAYMSDAGLQQVVTAFGNPTETRPNGQQISLYQHHLQVKFQSAGQETAAVAALAQILQAHGVTVLGSGFAPKVDASTLATMDGVFALLRTLVIVAVLLSTLLILNTVTTLITEQTAIIGTMKALGGTRGTILRGYLVSITIASVFATVPAILAGLQVGNLLATTLAPQIPLELGPPTTDPGVVALSLAVGLGVPLVAALLPLWNGTRISVREALSAYGIGISAGHGPLARLGQRLTWVSQLTWLALRGLFRRRWRAALALTTLTLAAACFLVVQTATTSINDTIGAVRAPIVADMTVSFGDPATFGQMRAQLSALPNVQRIERTGGSNAATRWGTLQVAGYEPDTQIYHYQLTSGRWLAPGDTDVILLSDAALAKTGLHLGDTITLTNNFGAKTQLPLVIIGTLRQSIDVLGWIGAGVMPVNTLYELRGMPAATATSGTQEITIAARDRSSAAVNALAREVAQVVNPDGFSDDGTGYFRGMGGTVDTEHEYTIRRQGDAYILYYLLYALALIVGAVGSLELATALVASVVERRREIGLLRAMGASGRRVGHVFWVESLALGAISWAGGAVVGLPLAYAFVHSFAALVMPVDFYLDPVAFGVMLAAVLVIASLASLAPAWRASRLRVAEILRYE